MRQIAFLLAALLWAQVAVAQERYIGISDTAPGGGWPTGYDEDYRAYGIYFDVIGDYTYYQDFTPAPVVDVDEMETLEVDDYQVAFYFQPYSLDWWDDEEDARWPGAEYEVGGSVPPIDYGSGDYGGEVRFDIKAQVEEYDPNASSWSVQSSWAVIATSNSAIVKDSNPSIDGEDLAVAGTVECTLNESAADFVEDDPVWRVTFRVDMDYKDDNGTWNTLSIGNLTWHHYVYAAPGIIQDMIANGADDVTHLRQVTQGVQSDQLDYVLVLAPIAGDDTTLCEFHEAIHMETQVFAPAGGSVSDTDEFDFENMECPQTVHTSVGGDNPCRFYIASRVYAVYIMPKHAAPYPYDGGPTITGANDTLELKLELGCFWITYDGDETAGEFGWGSTDNTWVNAADGENPESELGEELGIPFGNYKSYFHNLTTPLAVGDFMDLFARYEQADVNEGKRAFLLEPRVTIHIRKNGGSWTELTTFVWTHNVRVNYEANSQ